MIDPKSIHHVLNPLHIFCRLIGLGLNPKAALVVVRIYEATIWKAIEWTLNRIS